MLVHQLVDNLAGSMVALWVDAKVVRLVVDWADSSVSPLVAYSVDL